MLLVDRHHATGTEWFEFGMLFHQCLPKLLSISNRLFPMNTRLPNCFSHAAEQFQLNGHTSDYTQSLYRHQANINIHSTSLKSLKSTSKKKSVQNKNNISRAIGKTLRGCGADQYTVTMFYYARRTDERVTYTQQSFSGFTILLQ